MREIKFRAWDRNYSCIYDWGEICIESAQIFITDGDLRYSSKDESLVLMQYTGLKDKNGKEVYEGDIVLDQWTHYDTKFRRHEVRFGQHETSGDYYASTAYGWFISGEESLTPDLARQIEVIGNIYENKDLLEAKEI